MKHLSTRARLLCVAAVSILAVTVPLLSGCATRSPSGGSAENTFAPSDYATAAPLPTDTPQLPVVWQDARFEACVRTLLELPEGDIYPDSLAGVTSLCFYGNTLCRTSDDAYRYDAATDSVALGGKVYPCEPMSLADAAHFPALQTLAVHGGALTGGLDVLASLRSLKHLSLTDCGLDTLTFIAGCGSLESLDVSGNPVSDLTPLKSLSGLSELSLANTAVSDISALSALSLTSVALTGAPVTDYSALSPAVRLSCGVQTSLEAALAYGEEAALPTDADGVHRFGSRSILWTSSEPDTAEIDGAAVRAGSVQYALGTGAYACTLTGQYENSDAVITLLLTVGNGKTYAEKWGSRVTLARSVYGYPKTLTPKIENCTGFSLVSRQTAVKGDPFSEDWQIWIKENGRTWKAVHTFRVTPGEYQYFDVSFETPITFNAVSIAPASKLSSANTYNGGFELYCLRFANAD